MVLLPHRGGQQLQQRLDITRLRLAADASQKATHPRKSTIL
jgi:hypothetical protein